MRVKPSSFVTPTASLALAALACGWSAPAAADSFTIRLSAYVPTRCSGSLSLAGGAGAVRTGAITTNCNTAFSMTMHYPADLGPVEVAYQGRTRLGANGEVTLAHRSPPSAGVAPVSIAMRETMAYPNAPFSIVLSPQGL